LAFQTAAGRVFNRRHLKCGAVQKYFQDAAKAIEDKNMLMRTIVTLAAILAIGTGNGFANAHKTRRHHHHGPVIESLAASPVAYGGGRLVAHPASNIACMTRDRATRALPCDQPIWVYGSPCEVDLGLGRSRSCD
jgi:hypothetical protein